jgi:thiamine pyrophosphokinase
MKKDVCYIICAGEKLNLPVSIPSNCYVIAVDAGYEYLIQSGIKPDLVVGDFDSLNYVPKNEQIIHLPKVKDDTDTLFAIKAGMLQGSKEFHIYCGTGGHLAHTFANIQCLSYIANKKLKGILYDGDYVMTAISNDELKISNGRGYISVFSLTTESKGVNLEGLKYPLKDYTMSNSYPIGVNNEFIGKDATIKVAIGTLLIHLPITSTI